MRTLSALRQALRPSLYVIARFLHRTRLDVEVSSDQDPTSSADFRKPVNVVHAAMEYLLHVVGVDPIVSQRLRDLG